MIVLKLKNLIYVCILLICLRIQPSGSNQISVFWEIVEQKPGPIVAAIVMLGIGELISGFAITSAKVPYLSMSLTHNETNRHQFMPDNITL